MTVRELIELLKEMPQDDVVIMEKDAKGNGYSPLYCVDGNAIYQKDTEWNGEVYSKRWSWEESGFTSKDEWAEFLDEHPPCVVLGPMN